MDTHIITSEPTQAKPTGAASSEPVPGVAKLLEFLARHEDPAVPYQTPLDAVHSVSHGYAHRVPGITTGRIHHLQSRWEYYLFLVLDMSRACSQILEGVPLPLPLSEHFAQQTGVKHPWNWQKRQIATMTVDFVARLHSGAWIAIDFKQSFELTRPRVKEKLEIARLCFAASGIGHEVKTEKDIPMAAVANFRGLHALGTPFDPPPLDAGDLEVSDLAMRKLLRSGKITIRQAALAHDASAGLGSGRLIRLAMWLIARGRWQVDLTRRVDVDLPLTFLSN